MTILPDLCRKATHLISLGAVMLPWNPLNTASTIWTTGKNHMLSLVTVFVSIARLAKGAA